MTTQRIYYILIWLTARQALSAVRFMRLHGQAVKTPPFHGGNRGSIPLGVTKKISDVFDVRFFYLILGESHPCYAFRFATRTGCTLDTYRCSLKGDPHWSHHLLTNTDALTSVFFCFFWGGISPLLCVLRRDPHRLHARALWRSLKGDSPWSHQPINFGHFSVPDFF